MIDRSDDEPPSPADLFRLPEDGPDDPRPIVRRLVDEDEQFRDLKAGEAVIMVVLRADAVVKGGKQVLGTMALPRWQGSMGPMALWLLAKACGGTVPDFILTLDAGFWQDASPHQREALVFHELMHAEHAQDKDGEPRFDDDGRPVWGIRTHDLEEFNVVVERFGAWKGDIQAFATSLARGGVLP